MRSLRPIPPVPAQIIIWTLALGALLAAALSAFGGDQSVRLAWNSNPEPDIAGYLVYYGNASRVYPRLTNVGNVTSTTVQGLADGTNWFFALTAVNTAGLESDFSNEVTTRIPAKPQRVVITTNFWIVPPMRTITVTEPAK